MGDDNFIYTADLVRAVFNNWHRIEGVKERGTLALTPTHYTNTTEQKIATDELTRAWPRANRRSHHRPYQIDDVGAVCVDIFSAMERLERGLQARLTLHFLFGYSYEELGDRLDMSEIGVRKSCDRAIERIAASLNDPKERLPVGRVPATDDKYRQTYASAPGAAR